MVPAIITARRRRFWLLLGSSFVLVAIAAGAWIVWSRPSFPNSRKLITSVDIIYPGPVESEIVDPKIIQKVIVEPFHKSSIVFFAAKYEVVGMMQVNYADGSHDSATLFHNWSHWEHEGRYRRTDLSLLHDECRALLQRSTDPKAKELLDMKRIWKPTVR